MKQNKSCWSNLCELLNPKEFKMLKTQNKILETKNEDLQKYIQTQKQAIEKKDVIIQQKDRENKELAMKLKEEEALANRAGEIASKRYGTLSKERTKVHELEKEVEFLKSCLSAKLEYPEELPAQEEFNFYKKDKHEGMTGDIKDTFSDADTTDCI